MKNFKFFTFPFLSTLIYLWYGLDFFNKLKNYNLDLFEKLAFFITYNAVFVVGYFFVVMLVTFIYDSIFVALSEFLNKKIISLLYFIIVFIITFCMFFMFDVIKDIVFINFCMFSLHFLINFQNYFGLNKFSNFK